MEAEPLAGVIIVGLVLIFILRWSKKIEPQHITVLVREPIPAEEPGVVLIVRVHLVDERLVCSATGPGGGYKLGHSMFAAAVLSAEAVREMGEGVEGGLQAMEQATMRMLKEGVEA